MRFVHFLACGLLGFCFQRLSQGSDLPDLGDSARLTLSRKQEQAFCHRLARELRQVSDLTIYLELEDYLNRIGQRIVAVSKDNRQTFEFFLLNSPEINALATPGGCIGVYSGIIQLVQTESELASILAHEIAHVTQRHFSRFEEKGKNALLGALALAAAGILVSGEGVAAGVVGAQAALAQSAVNFTREHEYEADRVGIEALAAADFDARAMEHTFKRLMRRSDDERALNEYSRRHPLTSSRIGEAAARAYAYPPRLLGHSIEFNLVRERLRALEGAPNARITAFQQALGEGKYNLKAATQYGLAVAYLRAGKTEEALRLIKAAKQALSHPLLDSLLAKIYLERRQPAAALSAYRVGLASAPHNLALHYGLIRYFLDHNDAKTAVSLARAQILKRKKAGVFYGLLAEGYARLDREVEQRAAQAEYYYWQGRLEEATFQLQRAIQVSASDFYQRAALESRLQEWTQEKDLMQ